MDTLSDRLDAFRHGLARFADTGCTLEPQAVATLCALLEDFAAEARRLEAGGALPDNVIRIAEILARKGVQAGLPVPPDGAEGDGAA